MKYYVKNPSGGVSQTTEKIYNRLLDNDDYECWTVDPYENLPEEVEEILGRSTDYPVLKVREMVADMDESEIEDFIEGDTRKTVQALI